MVSDPLPIGGITFDPISESAEVIAAEIDPAEAPFAILSFVAIS